MIPWLLGTLVFGVAFGYWERAVYVESLSELRAVPAALLSWTLLHAGTLWLNAARDQDSGPVLWGQAVEPPANLDRWGYAALVGCLALAGVCGPVVFGAAVVCAVLAVLYSHPRTAWKAHPWLGPLTNIIGYGLMTPIAGMALAQTPVVPRTVGTVLFTAAGMAGTYFAAQAWQATEDRERGDRTLVATHGPTVVLRVARALLLSAAGGAVVFALYGWYPRACLVALPAIWISDRHLRAWITLPEGGTEAMARGMLRKLLITALLLVTAAVGTYFVQLATGRPVCGEGTVRGHPGRYGNPPPPWEKGVHPPRDQSLDPRWYD
jgi:hypothetical protein